MTALPAFGAIPVGDGRVRFRLWAPTAEKVEVELSETGCLALHPVAQGFHERIIPCATGTRYQYRIDEGPPVPDPASRLQDGDVNDASIVLDPRIYSAPRDGWAGRPWTEAVLYEIHCGLAGGFDGVARQLPALAHMGFTAIELMPIADFPGRRNWGYDGVLPYAPDTSYGSPDRLRALIDQAHQLGLMVFLDVVYNHFGPYGNHLPGYAPEFFTNDVSTPWGAAIDFRQEAVCAFFIENALYWIRDYGFDGLRLDAVHAMQNRDWLIDLAQAVHQHTGDGRHVHLVLENDDNSVRLLESGYDAQWNDDAHHVVHHLLTGETSGYYGQYADNPSADLARVLSEGFVFQGQGSAIRSGRARGEPSADLPPSSFVFFLQNHDQIGNRAMGERLASLCGRDSAELHAAVALQLLAPHIPLVFMGEEQGTTAPFLYFTDYDDEELAAVVREGRRREFAHFPGFSSVEQRDRIPDPNALATWESSFIPHSSADAAARQWEERYRTLLSLRARHIVPHIGGARSRGATILGRGAVHASWKMGSGELLGIACNLGPESCTVPAWGAGAPTLLYSSRPETGIGVPLVLPPGTTIAVIERREATP